MIISGPLDVILIYRNVHTGTFHPAFYYAHAIPGVIVPEEQDIVRLVSSKHHTDGFATLDEAQEFVRTQMQQMFVVSDRNVMLDPPLPWSGETGDVMTVPNWLKRGPEVAFRDVVVTSH